jgi:hypothetical protein
MEYSAQCCSNECSGAIVVITVVPSLLQLGLISCSVTLHLAGKACQGQTPLLIGPILQLLMSENLQNC